MLSDDFESIKTLRERKQVEITSKMNSKERQEEAEKLRQETVMGAVFAITGDQMPLSEYLIYMDRFNKAKEIGEIYNIKDWIKDFHTREDKVGAEI